MYESLKEELDIDDFVGPIEAFLEVYEFNGKNPVRRGPIHPIMPQGTQEDHPPIWIADILTCSHVNPRDKRETFLDIERYRKCLTASFQKLALFRALDMLRPGPKVYWMAELLKSACSRVFPSKFPNLRIDTRILNLFGQC